MGLETQPSSPAGLGGRESLTTALNRDALEEVFVHCSVADLLNLGSTCRAAAELLTASEKIWVAKLRESFGLSLKAVSASDGLFVRLARRVYEASRAQPLRFQGVFVSGGVDEDAMHYFVDNLFRPDKAPYCSNCSRDADCIALLLDGAVPRDEEFAQVRQYMTRRCRYAAALIMNVQMPEHGRDPDDIMHILEDWTDMQLEGFFKDLVGAMLAEHALGRLLVFDIPHERLAAEEEHILAVHEWLLERPRVMRSTMVKSPADSNIMFDASVMPKLAAPEAKRLAGVVHEVSLSRIGNLTCPVSAGAVVVGSIDHSKVQGWAPEQVLQLLQQSAAGPDCAALNGMTDAAEVQQAAAAGLLPPILCTDQTLAGIWHEFDTSRKAGARQAAAQQAAAAAEVGGGCSRQAADAAAAANEQGQQPQQQHKQQQDSRPASASSSHRDAPSGAAAAEAGSSSVAAAQQQVSPAGIISWKPLLWFKFHSADEATSFLQRHRQLVEQHGSQATVRHRGPPPTRRGHVTAAVAGGAQHARPAATAPTGPAGNQHADMLLAQMQQAAIEAHAQQDMPEQAPHFQQQQAPAAWQPQAAAGGVPAQQQQQQQPLAAAVGFLEQPPMGLAAAPAPPNAPQLPIGYGGPAGQQGTAAPPGPAAAAPAAAAVAGGEQQGVAAPAAAAMLPAGAAAGGFLAMPGLMDSDDDEAEQDGESEDSLSAHMDDDVTDDSGSDLDEEAQVPGAWLADWVHDEFGADLQQEQDVVVAGQGLPFDQMDEGSSDDGDGADLEAEEHFDLGGAGGAPGGQGGAGGAQGPGQGQGQGQPQLQASAAETLLRALTRRSTRARNRLRVPLSRPVGGNMLLVKLISQENLMDQYGDPHTWPNIDMTFCGLNGKQVELPAGVTVAP